MQGKIDLVKSSQEDGVCMFLFKKKHNNKS